ncbi:RNA binding (RRM/RBD/RNP motifs) family protein isoform X2 [Wolffia australiana]
MQSRTVQVGNVSDLAGEREVAEFFSFSGEIERVEIVRREPGKLRTAFVTFKDPRALEIALLLSGATIVDHIVTITPAENYTSNPSALSAEPAALSNPQPGSTVSPIEEAKSGALGGNAYVSKAQDVVFSVLAKGTAIKQDAVNKAKSFDEKHRLTANASAKVMSFDRRVGLTDKIHVGFSVVNEKAKSVDQKLQVSDKTMAILTVAEQKLIDTGTAVKTHRYVATGTAWFNGAFSRVARAGHMAGMRTKEKFQTAVSNFSAKDPPIAA